MNNYVFVGVGLAFFAGLDYLEKRNGYTRPDLKKLLRALESGDSKQIEHEVKRRVITLRAQSESMENGGNPDAAACALLAEILGDYIEDREKLWSLTAFAMSWHALAKRMNNATVRCKIPASLRFFNDMLNEGSHPETEYRLLDIWIDAIGPEDSEKDPLLLPLRERLVALRHGVVGPAEKNFLKEMILMAWCRPVVWRPF